MLSVHLTLVTVLKLLQQYLNPFTPTCWKTVAHFCQFLTVLEYSSMKFPPITASYTVKKNWKIFNTFSDLKVWMFLINFDAKTRFLNLFIIYIVNNFLFFYYRNLIRDYLLQIDMGKSWKTTSKFFLTVHFHIFPRFSSHCYHNFMFMERLCLYLPYVAMTFECFVPRPAFTLILLYEITLKWMFCPYF